MKHSNAQQEVTSARNNNNDTTNDLSLHSLILKDGQFADQLFNIVLSIAESLSR